LNGNGGTQLFEKVFSKSVENRNPFSGELRIPWTEESKVEYMFCKIVKQLTVVPPGEYSNKPSVKARTHKLFVALPGYTPHSFATKMDISSKHW
jgi:hypothetical protein